MREELKEWPGPEYHVRQVFRAPRRYVFDWCTDYSPIDPQLEEDEYTRKIVQRGRGLVVYEDLQDSPEGWAWSQTTVELDPPRGWKMKSLGNRRIVIADYVLTELPGGRTQLDLRWRRRASLLDFTPQAKVGQDREGKRAWGRFARALESDYRKVARSSNRRVT